MAAVLLGNQSVVPSVAKEMDIVKDEAAEANEDVLIIDGAEEEIYNDDAASVQERTDAYFDVQGNSSESGNEQQNDTLSDDLIEDDSKYASEEESGLSILASLELITLSDAANSYELKAVWNVKNTNGIQIPLALGMDETVYESMPEEMQADETGMCHISVQDDNKTVAMKKMADPNDEERILLVYDQIGDGVLALDLELTAENISADCSSDITAEWYDSENVTWMIEVLKEVRWQAVPAETLAESSWSETIEETDASNTEIISAVAEIEETVSETYTEEETEEETEVITEETAEENGSAGVVTVNAADWEVYSLEEFAMEESITLMSTTVDLTDYLTGVTVSEPNDSNVLSVNLSYQINTSVLYNNTNVVTYQLPSAITPLKQYTGPVYDNGTAVGTYVVNQDGSISITFDSSYITATAEEITGTLEFYSLVDKSQADSEGKVEIVFSENYKKTVTINVAAEVTNDVQIGKKLVNYTLNQSSNSITYNYEVEISTTKGTGEDISVRDALNVQWHTQTLSYGKITVEKYASDGELVTDNSAYNNNLVVHAGTKNEGGQYSEAPYFEGTLPKLEENEKYVVKYSVTETLAAGETKSEFGNTSSVENNKVKDSDSVWVSEELYDLSVEKTSPGDPVIDAEKSEATNSYKVLVSTVRGTQGTIDLEDVLSISGDGADALTKEYTIKSIKKISASKDDENLDSSLLVYSSENGKLTGTLPKLNAGESYEIEYELKLTGLPADSKTTFGLNNTVHVTDTINHKSSNEGEGDSFGWTGSSYCDWIEKTGRYDETNKKIYWTIELNKGAYGNINSMTLSDTLTLPGQTEGTAITGTVKMEEIDSNGSVICTYGVTLPFTFTNGAAVAKEGSTSETNAIDTSHMFRITYETTVDETQLTGFQNVYKNHAELGGHGADGEASVTNNIIDKVFAGSEATDNGFKLKWNSYLDIPAEGLLKNGYYEDVISDSQYNESHNCHWFLKENLQELQLSIGETVLTEGTDYQLTVNGWKADGSWFVDIPLSSVESGSKIGSFKITFLKDIAASLGDKVKISYSSYATGTEVAFNTGKYTWNDVWVQDRALGRGSSGNLIQKTNADGTETQTKKLTALWDESLEKYVLAYKLVVNPSNTASGDITVTDTLPEGCTLVTDGWTISNSSGNLSYSSDNKACIGGVYFRYYKYYETNLPDNMPYSKDESDQAMIRFNTNWKEVYGMTAGDAGITVSVSGQTITIQIPESAYKISRSYTEYGTTYELESDSPDPNLTMVLYYVVSVDPSKINQYDTTVTNSCSLTTTTGGEGSDTVTNTVTTEAIGKEGEYDSSDKTLQYVVDINKNAINLTEDGTGQVTVVDTLQYTKSIWCNEDSTNHKCVDMVALKPGTMMLYEVTTGEAGVQTETLSSDPFTYELVHNEGNSVLTVKVPDGKFYRLKYEYLISVNKEIQDCKKNSDADSSNDVQITITNNAKIEGIAISENSSSEETVFEAYNSSATAQKSYTTVTLFKTDSNNASLMLAGAEFRLERYNGTGWSVISNPSPDGSGGVTEIFVTGEDGSVALGEKQGDIYRIGYNCAYRLTEVKAPAGYQLIADPMYFYVESKTQTTKIVPTDWETNTAYTEHMLNVLEGGYLFISDDKQEDSKTDFEADKIWLNPDGTTPGEIPAFVEMKLYRSVSETDMSNGVEIAPAILNASNGWHYVWQQLDKYQSDGTTPYYYYVRETEREGWSVSYSNDKALASDAEERVVIVTNRKKEDTTSVNVSKVWKNADGSVAAAPLEDEVTVHLKRKYQTKEGTTDNVKVTVIVNGKTEVSQSETEARTLVNQSTDVPYGSVITIKMNSPGWNHFSDVTSFSTSVSPVYGYGSENIGNDTWVSTETLQFTVYQDTTVTIGNSYCTFTPDSFKLEYTAPDGTQTSGEWIADTSFDEVRILSAANNWQYTWDTLQKSHGSGALYHYYVEEDAPAGYSISYQYTNAEGGTETGAVAGGNVVVTNQATTEGKTSITVNKSWKDSDGNAITN